MQVDRVCYTVVSDTPCRITYATIPNRAVYLSGRGLAFLLTWFPDYKHSFCWINPILYLHNVDILKLCIKEFGVKKTNLYRMTAMRTKTHYFTNMAFIYTYMHAQIVPLWADQLLPEFFLWMNSILYLHNVSISPICMKGFGAKTIIFWQNDSYTQTKKKRPIFIVL